jgi:hypothetical protein
VTNLPSLLQFCVSPTSRWVADGSIYIAIFQLAIVINVVMSPVLLASVSAAIVCDHLVYPILLALNVLQILRYLVALFVYLI